MARAGAEGCVGGGGIAVYGWDLSSDVDFMEPGSVRVHRRDDAQPIFRPRDSFVASGAEPVGSPQPDRLRRIVELCPRRGYGDHGIAGCERTRTPCGGGYPHCDRSTADRAGSGKAGRRAGIGGECVGSHSGKRPHRRKDSSIRHRPRLRSKQPPTNEKIHTTKAVAVPAQRAGL